MLVETTWLQTFCGTLKYMAPEVFPFNDTTHGPPADVWSLGVMALEWLHGIPVVPVRPAPRPAQKNVSRNQWRDWAGTWADMLVTHLEDQEEGLDVDLLRGMLVIDQARRLTAHKGLMMGFKNGLFKRRAVDGLVVCGVDREDEEPNANLDSKDDLERPVPVIRAAAEDVDPNATISTPWRAQKAVEAGGTSSDAGADVDGSNAEPYEIFVRSGAPPPSISS